jgi:hypothetical protein
MDQTGGMNGIGAAAAAGGGVNNNIMNREQIKKMSEADKEMELRANRAKALLAERHIGLKENQVRFEMMCFEDVCSLFVSPLCVASHSPIPWLQLFIFNVSGGPQSTKDAARNSNEQGWPL